MGYGIGVMRSLQLTEAADFAFPFHSVLTAQAGDDITLINALDFGFTIYAYKANLQSD